MDENADNILHGAKKPAFINMMRVQTERFPPGISPLTDSQNASTVRRKCKSSWDLFALWLSPCFAVILLILTSIYACHPHLLAGYRIVGQSPSDLLLLLSVLSQLTGLLLAATISSTFEEVQWMFLSRNEPYRGILFTDYLSLQPGTAIMGLLRLALGFRVALSSRVWSMLRLTAMILVPLSNVVIMSDVNTAVTFDKIDANAPAYGYSLGNFNASMAAIWHPMADLLFSTNFMYFLSDGARVVDLTTPKAREQCQRDDLSKHQCKLTYYVAGSISDFAPSLLAHGHSRGDAFLAENQQGYVLEYEDGGNDWRYNIDNECSVFGADIAAWALCLRNGKENEIQAKLIDCPADIAAAFQCKTSTTWLAKEGFATSLKTWHRRATIAYDRINSSILTHTFDPSQPRVSAPISAAGLLQAFTLVFKSSNKESPFATALAALGIGNNTASAPMYAWWHFHGLSRLADQDAAARRRGISGLQSMLGLPIYHCQTKSVAELRDLGYDNTTSVGRAIMATFPSGTADTPIYSATLRYTLVIDQGTLVAYVILGGVTLLACFVGLVAASTRGPVANGEGPGSFPLIDFVTKCEVVQVKSSGNVDNMEVMRMRGKEESTLIATAKSMRVVLVKDST